MELMKKLSSYLKLDDNEEGEEYESYEDEDDYVETPPQEFKTDDSKVSKFADRKAQSAQARRRAPMTDSTVIVYKPVSFEEVREISETLLQNKTVLLNFEGLDLSVSRRILDVMIGVCIAKNGNLQQISDNIFIVTPPTVDVMGNFEDTIAGTFEGM